SLSRPVFFDYERNLVVAVKDSAVAQELSLRKHDILTNLHKMARRVGINLKGLRFDIKGYSRLKILEEQIAAEALLRESGGTQGPREPSKEELAALELNPEELAELENFKENLAPSEVSSRFFEIYERDLRRRAWLQRNASLVSGNCGSCGNAELRLHGENRLCGPCFVVSAAFLKDKNA
ncbi:MAG TPA: DciA family protein, partial [Candidatus Melainabacteria bacterium]|nr:DciA family protein [Candidatus Melainabacteria bacterium]